MSGDRIPLEGLTLSAEPDKDGYYAIHWPNGSRYTWVTAEALQDRGVKIPRPPLVGPKVTFADDTEVVMDEREVREWASDVIWGFRPAANALIHECRDLVREYDEKWGKS